MAHDLRPALEHGRHDLTVGAAFGRARIGHTLHRQACQKLVDGACGDIANEAASRLVAAGQNGVRPRRRRPPVVIVPDDQAATAALQRIMTIGRAGKEQMRPFLPPHPHLAHLAAAVHDGADRIVAQALALQLGAQQRQLDGRPCAGQLTHLDHLARQHRRRAEEESLTRLAAARTEDLIFVGLRLAGPHGVQVNAAHLALRRLPVVLQANTQPGARRPEARQPRPRHGGALHCPGQRRGENQRIAAHSGHRRHLFFVILSDNHAVAGRKSRSRQGIGDLNQGALGLDDICRRHQRSARPQDARHAGEDQPVGFIAHAQAFPAAAAPGFPHQARPGRLGRVLHDVQIETDQVGGQRLIKAEVEGRRQIMGRCKRLKTSRRGILSQAGARASRFTLVLPDEIVVGQAGPRGGHGGAVEVPQAQVGNRRAGWLLDGHVANRALAVETPALDHHAHP